MADAKLKIEVGLDAQDAVSGLGKLGGAINSLAAPTKLLENQIARLQKLISNPNLNFSQYDRLNSILKKTQGELTAFKKASDGLNLAKSVPGINQATNALTNVGRVAQDSAFGFVGIANNLNPLLESFQRLRAETGSNKAALSALGSSLLGAGGLGVALSIVTAAFSFAQLGMSAWTRGMDGAKKKSEELAVVIKKSDEIIGDATAGVQGQAEELKGLLKIVNDANKSDKERLSALGRIKDVNSDLTKGITLQADGLKTLTGRVNEYTEALIAAAIVDAFKSEIGKVALEQNKAATEVEKAISRVRHAETELSQARSSAVSGREGLGSSSREADNAAKRLATANKELLDAQNKLTDSDISRVKLTNSLNKAQEDQNKLIKTKTGHAKEEKTAEELLIESIKNRISALDDLEKTLGRLSKAQKEERVGLQIKLLNLTGLKEGFKKEEIQQQIKKLLDSLELKPTDVTIPIEPIPVVGSNIESKVASALGLGKLKEVTLKDVRIKLLGKDVAVAIEDAEAIAAKLNASLKQLITQGAVDIGVGFGEAIGEGLAKGDVLGGFKKAAETILHVIGGVMADFGKQLIAINVAILLAKKAISLAFANPALGIAAGIGLVALGSLLKNIKFNVPAFADGGIVTKPTLGLFGEAGAEAVIPLDKLKGMIGGRQPIILNPEIGLGYDRLLLKLQIAQQNFNRGV